MIYLAFPDNIDYLANCTGSYDQGDPLAELRLIQHHEEHNVLIVPCNLLHLYSQNDETEWARTFPAQSYKVQWVVN